MIRTTTGLPDLYGAVPDVQLSWLEMLSVIFPTHKYEAIEERYAAWQSELMLRRAARGATWLKADLQAEAADLLSGVNSESTLIVTTPLILPPSGLLEHLQAALTDRDAIAALPVLNITTVPRQHEPPDRLYLTLRQLEDVAAAYAEGDPDLRSIQWQEDDPTIALVRTSHLKSFRGPLLTALKGQRVVITRKAYVHRFAEHRAQLRLDLLERIDPAAKSVLEFGCGEGGLGEALKQRQSCRVVGVELDASAARIAETRLDAVHQGDVRDVIARLDEKFDFVVGGDILEHIDDPWVFLEGLRNVVRPGGQLLLSLPNVSAWPIVADLLQGRFDYVYMGILCAGHIRFFTKQTVRDMLEISGWTEVALTDQYHFPSPEFEDLRSALVAGGIPHSSHDLLPTGHYVLARRTQ